MRQRIFRLRISISAAVPDIWRLLEVRETLTLAELHDVIQISFGWNDSHLHQFIDSDPQAAALPRVGRSMRSWRMPDPDDTDLDDVEVRDEFGDTVGAVFDELRGPLFYEYDFGDSWIHVIEVIEVIDDDRHAPPARLIRGSRRAPLEDSGGPYGYGDLLDILADPGHERHEELRDWSDWVAGPWDRFDPEAVDEEAINRELDLRFGPPTDLSGLVALSDLDTVAEPAPLIDLLAKAPVPVRRRLRGVVQRDGVLEPLHLEHAEIDEATAPLRWILDRAHDPGIDLTAAGWMRPATVKALMTELGYAEDWIGTGNREDQTAPAAELRWAAMRLRLLRAHKGRLLLTRLGASARRSSAALWSVAAANISKALRTDAERDALALLLIELARDDHAPARAAFETVADGLELLDWQGAGGGHIEVDHVAGLLRQALPVLDIIGVTGSPRLARAFARHALNPHREPRP